MSFLHEENVLLCSTEINIILVVFKSPIDLYYGFPTPNNNFSIAQNNEWRICLPRGLAKGVAARSHAVQVSVGPPL